MKPNIIGNKYGHLTVIPETKNKWKKTAYHVKCDCGRISPKVHTKFNLESGMIKTCNHPDCEYSHLIHRNGQLTRSDQISHGLSHTKEYETWNSIKQRCYNETNISYKHYGGRGITRYEPWIDDFQAFYDYLQTLPETREQFEARTGLSGRKVTLDRIDTNIGYIPGNLRWASQHEQVQNQNTNRLNEDIVKQLRIDYYINHKPSTQIHKEFEKQYFPIHYGTIWNAISGKSWSNISSHKIINGNLVIQDC
jgi:hypothetical protein